MTEPREPSELCLTCGLCCDGSIFTTVRLAAAEVEAARRHRLPVIEGPDRALFMQPCPCHENGTCAVYAERPGACSGFTCITLGAYVAGDIDRAAAEARIERLRAAAARIRAQLPAELRDVGLWQATSRFSIDGEGGGDPVAWRQRHAGLLLDIALAERISHRDFVAPDR